MTDQMIQRFRLEGRFDDNKYEQVKESATKTLIGQMKDQGFIPVLDLDYTWRTQLVGDHFEYVLTIQGVYIGVDEAWHYLGTVNGKPVPSSPKTK